MVVVVSVVVMMVVAVVVVVVGVHFFIIKIRCLPLANLIIPVLFRAVYGALPLCEADDGSLSVAIDAYVCRDPEPDSAGGMTTGGYFKVRPRPAVGGTAFARPPLSPVCLESINCLVLI